MEEAAEEPETALLYRSDDLLTLAVQYAIASVPGRGHWRCWMLTLTVLVSSLSRRTTFFRGDVPLPPALFKLANWGSC